MSTINSTQPLAELRNHPRRSCHQLGICQNPHSTCQGECHLPALIKLGQPKPLPTLAPGVLDGPYRRHRTEALRDRRWLARVWLGLVVGCAAFLGAVIYAIL